MPVTTFPKPVAPPGPARVELLDDVVVKTLPPELAVLEADRTRRGAELGHRCGLYAAPALVEVDRPRGRLVFERVPGITPLRAHLADPGREALLDRAAAALCAIHAGLEGGEGRVEAAEPWLDGRAPAVWLHGDYSPTNLQLQAGTGKLWILDWAAPGWLPPRLGRGAPSFDLAAFVLPLFWQRPGDPSPVPSPEAAGLCFLRAWSACSGLPLGPAAAHILRLQRHRLPYAAARVSRVGVLARLPMQLRCVAWLLSLARRGERDQS